MGDYNKDSLYARNEYRQAHEPKTYESENSTGKLPESEPAPVISNIPKRVSVINWFFTIFICYIPVINIFTLLIWAFSKDTNPSKKSFAKAKLIWTFIELIIVGIAVYFLYGYISRIIQL